MNRIIEISSRNDIPERYKNTAIEKLISFHNLHEPLDICENAELLIGMCMDNRNSLRMPQNFAYIIRTGGGNLQNSEFKVSYAIAIGGISHIALLAHTNCGMAQIHNKRDIFIEGLITKGGWSKKDAENHYNTYAPLFEIGNEIDFVLRETKRLRLTYPKIQVTPLLYKVEDNKIYGIEE